MADITLVDREILALGEALVTPFSADCVNPASYDLRVGSRVWTARPREEGGVVAQALEQGDEVSVPPGQTCIIQTLEKVKLDINMKGRISLRSYWATRLLSHAGGLIDPGYKGYLYLPIVNISHSPVRISFGEPVVTAEFVRLSASAEKPYGKEEVLTLADSRKPLPPERRPYNPIEMTVKIEKLAAYEPLIESTRRILDTVILAAVGGGIAGLSVGAIMLVSQSIAKSAFLYIGMLILVLVVVLAALFGVRLGQQRKS